MITREKICLYIILINLKKIYIYLRIIFFYDYWNILGKRHKSEWLYNISKLSNWNEEKRSIDAARQDRERNNFQENYIVENYLIHAVYKNHFYIKKAGSKIFIFERTAYLWAAFSNILNDSNHRLFLSVKNTIRWLFLLSFVLKERIQSAGQIKVNAQSTYYSASCRKLLGHVRRTFLSNWKGKVCRDLTQCLFSIREYRL